MRHAHRLVVVVITTMLVVAGVVPAAAQGKKQVVEGNFLAPAKHTDGGCFSGLSRRLWVLSGGYVNGATGYVFDVDKKTWNKKFELEPTGGQGHIDIDIVFYPTLGDAAEQLDPTVAPASFSFETRSITGEAGVVPKTSTKAIVCSFIDENHPPAAAAAISFKYTAG